MSIKSVGLILFCSFAFFHQATAQPGAKPAGKLSAEGREMIRLGEDTLAVLAYAVVNDSIEQERFAACRALITCLVRTLKVENSYKYQFDRLRSLSVLAPPDSSFRIFTWQLFVNDSTYRYFGAIQLNRKELKLFPLIDRSDEMESFPAAEQLTPERWYGMIYYNLRQFDTKEGRKYLLLGFDSYDFYTRRKVVDVLSFDAAGKPVFGAPVFDRDGKVGPPELRIYSEYAAEASFRMNWDEQYQMVLIDHAVPMPSPYGSGVVMVPDGSYDALKLDKGRWKYVSKVFNDVMSETPRPEPVLDDRKNKDIMGKEKRKTKN
jgi:hypothetical protein